MAQPQWRQRIHGSVGATEFPVFGSEFGENIEFFNFFKSKMISRVSANRRHIHAASLARWPVCDIGQYYIFLELGESPT